MLRFQFLHGATRWVFLVGRFAIKVPRCQRWQTFLWGLLANMQECTWSGQSDRLCPVIWSLPGGWMLVMPRCEPLQDESFRAMNFEAFRTVMEPMGDEIMHVQLPVEKKICSFGWLGDRLVAVDYGS